MRQESSPTISRRQLLKLAGFTAGVAFLDFNHTPRQLISTLTKHQATQRSEQRRQTLGNSHPETPLSQALGSPKLAENKQIGLVNHHHFEETENIDIGNFTFPVNPLLNSLNIDSQQIALFGNSHNILSFRGGEPLENFYKRLFDRTVWALSNNIDVTAVVELDNDFSETHYKNFIEEFSSVGINKFIIGNEPNDRLTPWRKNYDRILKFGFFTQDILSKKFGSDYQISTPAMAYYQGQITDVEDLKEMLLSFKSLSSILPFQRVSSHYYGPTSEIPNKIMNLRHSIESVGLNLPLDITEIGNPVNTFRDNLKDQEIAENLIPQTLALSLGTKLVEKVYWYSLIDATSPQHSLSEVQNGELLPHSSYQSFSQLTKLLTNLESIEINPERNISKVIGQTKSNKSFEIIWSRSDDQIINLSTPPSARQFDVYGQELEGEIKLFPKPKPYLGGSARILVY